MRELLIEKYISPTEIIRSGFDTIYVWFDKNKDAHNINDNPSFICINSFLGITMKKWYKNGKLCRKKNRQNEIWYGNRGEVLKKI